MPTVLSPLSQNRGRKGWIRRPTCETISSARVGSEEKRAAAAILGAVPLETNSSCVCPSVSACHARSTARTPGHFSDSSYSLTRTIDQNHGHTVSTTLEQLLSVPVCIGPQSTVRTAHTGGDLRNSCSTAELCRRRSSIGAASISSSSWYSCSISWPHVRIVGTALGIADDCRWRGRDRRRDPQRL